MTVCIGALCANSQGQAAKAIIVASDRMVTMGNLTEFEHEVPKISTITDRVVALMAGDALRGSRIIREVTAQVPAGSSPVQLVAELTAAHYADSRRLQIENDIFKPRGIDMQQFYQALQQRMLPQLVGAIDQHVANFNLGVELLIGGVSDNGAHLFSVSNPGGTYNDFHQIGFHAIGSGTIHALQSIIGFGHTAARSLQETLFTVYASKRRAESAPGVGRDTDLLVVTEKGINRLGEASLKQLEELYNDYQRPVSQEIKTELAKLDVLSVPKEEENNEST